MEAIHVGLSGKVIAFCDRFRLRLGSLGYFKSYCPSRQANIVMSLNFRSFCSETESEIVRDRQVMSIMTECWSHSPHTRPAFHELERRLENLHPCDAVSSAWAKSLRVDGTTRVLNAMSR